MYSVLLYSLWWENMRKKEGKKRWNLWVRITINHQGLDDKATFLASQYSSRFDYSVDARMTFSRYQKTRAKENLIQWIRWAEKMCYIRWQSLLVFPKKNLPNHFSGHLVWKSFEVLLQHLLHCDIKCHPLLKCQAQQSFIRLHSDLLGTVGPFKAQQVQIFTTPNGLSWSSWIQSLHEKRKPSHKLWGFFMALKFAFGAGFSILLYGLPQYYLYFIISIGYILLWI